MKKLIPILFALVLILVLLPANEARAEDPSICTVCGQKSDLVKPYNEYMHEWYCTNPECVLFNNSYYGNPHTGGTATCTEQPVCSVCGQKYDSALGHDLSHHDAQSPTCTAVGWDEYDTCSRCDYSTYVEKPALGHKWKAATCTEPKTCERCGATEGSPLSDGHKPGKTVIENEDIHCISDSSYDEVVYCTVCKKELSRKHITYKSSHDYKPWEWHETITRKYYKCTKCGNFYWLHNPESWNMKPGLVRYANGAAVDYKAYATGPDDNGVLTVTPIRHTERDSTDDISLYLTPDDIYVWTWEKMNRIELVRDRTVLAIDPREITPEMFGLKEGETRLLRLHPDAFRKGRLAGQGGSPPR